MVSVCAKKVKKKFSCFVPLRMRRKKFSPSPSPGELIGKVLRKKQIDFIPWPRKNKIHILILGELNKKNINLRIRRIRLTLKKHEKLPHLCKFWKNRNVKSLYFILDRLE
jgi:hypothetical protein